MLLGAAIGLTVAATTGPSNPNDTGMSVGAGIWLLIASIISLFVGGWVAGALCGAQNDFDSTLHGFVMWGTTTALSAILLTTAGLAAIGGAVGAASNVAGGLAQNPAVTNPVRTSSGASSGTSSSDGSSADAFVRAQLSSVPNIRTVNEELVIQIVPAVQSGSSASQSQSAIDALASAGNMSRSEAQQTVDRWRQDYQNNQSSGSSMRSGSSVNGSNSTVDRSQMQQAANRATRTAAGASWWTFFALLLGACAACLGGFTGTRRPDFDFDSRR
jgi:hypothetical protein